MAELARVAAAGATLLLSIPLHPGMWFLRHQRERAMWWYNRILPYMVRRQNPLELHEGLMNTDEVGEVLLVSRRVGDTCISD